MTSELPSMKNEQIEFQITSLKEEIHLERREDRKVLDSALSKLADTMTELALNVRELSVTKDVTTRQICDLRTEVAELKEEYYKTREVLAGLKPVVNSNSKTKDIHNNMYLRIFEKLVTFGILGGILYKISGGG